MVTNQLLSSSRADILKLLQSGVMNYPFQLMSQALRANDETSKHWDVSTANGFFHPHRPTRDLVPLPQMRPDAAIPNAHGHPNALP